ncbi:MAG TPA: YfiR family protein [Terriglobales bacterium]|nr:YfiR family protein [Terriglobales bacterium]
MPVLWALIAATNLVAQQQRVSEYQVKATYLYNFGRFVRWPDNFASGKGNSFGVCVLGQDPFGPALNSTFAGETLDGKPVVIRRISKPEDAVGCRILFISSSEEVHLQAILAVLDDEGILTVSDMRDFTQRGGMIQFVLESNKIRFEINLASAESSGLVLSSELLKVASTVRRNAPPGE